MPINTLILSGTNNHDWTRTTPMAKKLLTDSGKFTVTVTEDPSTALEDADALAKYDLIFDDYNGPMWSDKAKANFEAAIKGGTGLVVLHAADNAFPGWVEFEKMAMLCWREGTGHGRFHDFKVAITDVKHPITRGVSDFMTTDELYHKLVHMHGVPYTTLATAFSSAESGGTGNDEPMMTVTTYGKGRVFQHMLGHVWRGSDDNRAIDNPGFQNTLLRGCEWAATGDVKD